MARFAAPGLLLACLLFASAVAAKDCYGPNCLSSPTGGPEDAEDFQGMGRVLPSSRAGTVEAEQFTQRPWGVEDAPGDLASNIVSFLGLPTGEDEDGHANEGELDNAPENDLQVGESADAATDKKKDANKKQAIKKDGNTKRDETKKDDKMKNETKTEDDKKENDNKKSSGSHEHEVKPGTKEANAARRAKAIEKHTKQRSEQKAKRAKAKAIEKHTKQRSEQKA